MERGGKRQGGRRESGDSKYGTGDSIEKWTKGIEAGNAKGSFTKGCNIGDGVFGRPERSQVFYFNLRYFTISSGDCLT